MRPALRSRSHHRSSTGHGPAHHDTAHARSEAGNAPSRPRAASRDRLRGEQSPVGHPYRIAFAVEHLDRIVEQHGRRGLGQLSRPRLTGLGLRYRLIAQRCQRDSFGGPTASAEDRHLNGLRPEQALHPDQRTAGAQPVLLSYAAPQRQLQRLGRHHFHRVQPQHGDRSGGSVVGIAAIQPAVQLPAHPVGGGILGQWFRTSPNPVQLFTVGGNGMDGQPGAANACRLEAAMQVARQRPAGERGGVDPVDRRVAVHHGVEFRWRFTARRTAAGLGAGEAMCGHCIGPEPGGHIGARQGGELADVSNSHAPQQVSQVFAARCREARFGGQLPDGQRGQEHRVPARLDDPSGTCGEDRGGQPVGDSHLAFGSGRSHRVDQPFRRSLLRTEIAGRAAHREHQEAGPQHLGARDQVVHRCGHVLEVAGIACRVGSDDVQLRASCLGLAAAQAAAHPRPSGRRRAGDDPVGQRDRHRRRGGQIGRSRRGHRGPIHAPDGQHPRHAHPCPLVFAQALIRALWSSRKRSSVPSGLRASAHPCPLVFAQALIRLPHAPTRRFAPSPAWPVAPG